MRGQSTRNGVMSAFGGPVRVWPERTDAAQPSSGAAEDMDEVRRALAGLGAGEAGLLRLYRPLPTAAFAPSDRASANYGAAVEAVQAFGFEPVERMAGGRLAVYDKSALILDLVAPHKEPRLHVLERYAVFADAIAEALTRLGVDARVGELSGEYCPGQYSVNGSGRIKLVGVAQRIGRYGYHLGAVISVYQSASARAAVEKAYGQMDLAFEPQTFGAIADLVPAVSFDAVRNALLGSLATRIDMDCSSGLDRDSVD